MEGTLTVCCRAVERMTKILVRMKLLLKLVTSTFSVLQFFLNKIFATILLYRDIFLFILTFNLIIKNL